MSTHLETDIERFISFVEMVARRSPHTVRSYRTSLRQYAAFLRRRRRTFRTATMDDAIAYAAALHASAPNTACTRLAPVRRIHAFLHAKGDVDRDVAQLIPNPRRDIGGLPAPTLEQVVAARNVLTTPRDMTIFGMFASTGLRISELRYCLLEHVDLDDLTITVLGKGRKWRTVQFDAYTRWALLDYLPARPRPDQPWLFSSPRAGQCRPIGEHAFREPLRRAAIGAGLPPTIWTPHALRRAQGRTLRRVGADPFMIRETYGHADDRMTGRYLDDGGIVRLPDELRQAITALERAAGATSPERHT